MASQNVEMHLQIEYILLKKLYSGKKIQLLEAAVLQILIIQIFLWPTFRKEANSHMFRFSAAKIHRES